MKTTEVKPIEKRYEFVLLFDVIDGNPNGDPDAGNAPRIDPETGQGLVTDVCLKRKIRNYVLQARNGQPPYDIYVKERGVLAQEQKKAYLACHLDPSETPREEARRWMCKNFYDVRTFGAVMTTGKTGDDDEKNGKGAKKRGEKKKLWNCGQVRGPVQIAFARSLDPILTLEHCITRVALTNVGDTGRGTTDPETGEEKAGSGQFGRKHTVPYALYRAHGFISPHFANYTGFGEADLGLFWEALDNMFEQDRSAARGQMALRQLVVFEHSGGLGSAPAHRLFELVKVERRDPSRPPRSFADYQVTIDSGHVPAGITLHEGAPGGSATASEA